MTDPTPNDAAAWYLVSALMPPIGIILFIVALVQSRTDVAISCFLLSILGTIVYAIIIGVSSGVMAL